MRHLKLFQETSGAAKVSILELSAGVGAEHSSVHSIIIIIIIIIK